MFLEKQVRADDRRLQIVYGHFKRNLEDIYLTANKSGAKVIACTLGSNLKDCPPFASLHRTDLTAAEKTKWDTIYQQGTNFETECRYKEAMEKYLAAAEIDSSYADLQFRLGRCYWNMAEYEKAKDSYVKARQQDTLRFRPDKQTNETIRRAAGDMAGKGVYLVDTADAFEENSPHGITGEELFYEHVHLNFKGNYLLAKTVFEQTEKLLPDCVKKQKIANQPLLTEDECAQYLAYTDWDRYNIAEEMLYGFIKKAPFTGQLYHDQQVREMEQALESLKKTCFTAESLEQSAVQYRYAIEKDPADWQLRWKYGRLLSEELKSYWAAAEQYRLVKSYLPNSHIGYFHLGKVLGPLKETDAAIANFLQAIRIKPTSADLHYNLAMLYDISGMSEKKAAEYYTNTLRFNPNHSPAYLRLGTLLYRQGKMDQAIEVFRKGLVFDPNNTEFYRNLGVVLKSKGRSNEAIEALQAYLRIDPNSAEIRKELKAMLKEQGQANTLP